MGEGWGLGADGHTGAPIVLFGTVAAFPALTNVWQCSRDVAGRKILSKRKRSGGGEDSPEEVKLMNARRVSWYGYKTALKKKKLS